MDMTPPAERPAFVPGAFEDMPAATYHAIECMSSGGAKKILRSPAHFRLMRDGTNEPTAAMELGTAVHEGVLEPETFVQRVTCVPNDAPRRPTSAQINAKKPSPETIDAIAYWREFAVQSAGKIILSQPDMSRALACIQAVTTHPAAQALLDGSRRELSLFWHDGATNVPCKARLDVWNGGIGDLKTCTDASPEKFSRAIADYLYHAQAWHYYSGAEHALNVSPEFFTFIAVESEPPHAVAVYKLDRPSMLAGADLIEEALRRYKQCAASGVWPGYQPTIEPINVPRWALRRY